MAIYENPVANGFVRFVKGSQANWDALTTKDNNTLYFIVNSNGENGKLYLGSTLISNVNNGVTSLHDLTDTDFVVSNLTNRDILIYNTTSLKWETTNFDTLFATKIADVNKLTYKKVASLASIDTTAADVDQYIYLVPKATNGTNDTYDEYMYIIDSQTGNGALEKVGDWDLDLSGYATTSDLSAMNTRVTSLETTVNGISGDTNNPGLVSRVGTLETTMSTKVGNLNNLVLKSGNTTLVEQVNSLTDQLTWKELVQVNE